MTNLEPAFSRLDRAFAAFLGQRTTFNPPEQAAFHAVVSRLSAEQAQGHNCLRVDTNTQALLLRSGLVSHFASPQPSAEPTPILPLVLEEDRLYLHRYWHYEQRLAQQLLVKTQRHWQHPNLDSALDRYFPTKANEPDWQRAAAAKALQQAFTIITGGPGTGKTTTVVKILALLQEFSATPLHIALAAPTGKAAMRLQESIAQHKVHLPCTTAIKHSIPEQVSTVHRLLGAKPASPYFHHDAEHPLAYDVVIVDEASMLDLALMSKLVDALKPDARLLLLGDKDQLASVESGAVLADLHAALTAHTVELKTSHRFNGPIKALADAINAGAAELAWQIVNTPHAAVTLVQENVMQLIAAKQRPYLQLIRAGARYPEIYTAFMHFQVLCATRQGPLSVMDINYHVEQRLTQQNLIPASGIWYSGRPILITQNNPTLHLYNGDIGICLPDPEQPGKLKVFFQRPDGSVKGFLPARITHCETVFAMTVHKSQGSEFDEVLVILPENMNPVLTKELLYTAITRAKKAIQLHAQAAIFTATVQQKIQRTTGLMQKLQSQQS